MEIAFLIGIGAFSLFATTYYIFGKRFSNVYNVTAGLNLPVKVLKRKNKYFSKIIKIKSKDNKGKKGRSSALPRSNL